MTGHLIVSTAVLAAALLAARFLPMTARTRYALLLCALLKLAIPTAIFDVIPAAAIPMPLRTFSGNALTTAIAAPRTNWPLVAYAAVAALLLARWLLLRARTVAAALRNSAPASPRELETLAAARHTLGIHTPIDIVRSPLCEAPAVVRTIRPVILLPARGCDDLSDDELRSLVLHECAHVARFDNTATLVQALATSIFWLHPLVWLTSRALTVAREQACDERVAREMRGIDDYLGALRAICLGIAAPRTAGVSCMASSNLKERTEHLMSYQTIERRALSHRIVVAAMLVVLAMSSVAMATQSADDPQSAGSSEFTGEPITIDVVDADIRDLMNTFSSLTGAKIVVHENAENTRVTIHAKQTPWDEVLDRIARENGLTITIGARAIRVSKK